VKTVTFVPSLCKGENPKMSGEVVLRLPTFNERMRYMKESGFKLSEKGEVEMGAANEKLDFLAKLVEISAGHYVSVSLKNSKGEEIKSYEDMQYDEECSTVLMEIGGLLLNGFKMGNV